MTLGVGGSVVQTPSGEEWRVGRLWLNRELPHWRKVRLGDVSRDTWWSIPDGGSLEDIGLALVVLVGALVVAVIVIPLLLFGVELILLGIAVALGILGRALLGRPWVVRATPRGDPASALTWKVVGLKRSARVIEEVAAALASGLSPSPGEAADLIKRARAPSSAGSS
jgi:hypothetical protein